MLPDNTFHEVTTMANIEVTVAVAQGQGSHNSSLAHAQYVADQALAQVAQVESVTVSTGTTCADALQRH